LSVQISVYLLVFLSFFLSFFLPSFPSPSPPLLLIYESYNPKGLPPFCSLPPNFSYPPSSPLSFFVSSCFVIPAILSPVPPIRLPSGFRVFSRPLPMGSPMKERRPLGTLVEVWTRGSEMEGDDGKGTRKTYLFGLRLPIPHH
jgi:hypothetical protein